MPADLEHEIRRVLPAIRKAGAAVVARADLSRAIVVKRSAEGEMIRLAVVPREVVAALASRGLISARRRGRVTRYHAVPTRAEA